MIVTVNGKNHNIFDRQDILDLITEYMGDEFANVTKGFMWSDQDVVDVENAIDLLGSIEEQEFRFEDAVSKFQKSMEDAFNEYKEALGDYNSFTDAYIRTLEDTLHNII